MLSAVIDFAVVNLGAKDRTVDENLPGVVSSANGLPIYLELTQKSQPVPPYVGDSWASEPASKPAFT
jgi:hypothetical protein